MNFGRRGLVGAALAVGALVKAGADRIISPAHAEPVVAGPVTLPELPWSASALEPVISERTISFHYGKHHRNYVETANTLAAGTPYADLPLVEIVQRSARDPAAAKLFNNAAQVWNHDFYWQSLAPKSGGQPGAQVSAMIVDAFGSYKDFHSQFVEAATGQFGSGWVWLALDRSSKKLTLVKTANADTPLTGIAYAPLAVLDVWEHAYYLDYQNLRKDHATQVLDKLFNWAFVEKNLETA